MNRVKQSEPVIGILLDDSFDEWLNALGMSLDAFTSRMMGSWVFNYVEALQTAGVKPVLFCISTRVERPTRFTHLPTGAQILVLPPTEIFQRLRRWLLKHLDGYSAGWHGAPNGIPNRIRRGIAWLIKSYLSTPLLALFKEIQREGCCSLLVQEYESVRFDICVLAGKAKGIPVFGTFTGGFPQIGLFRPLRSLALRLCNGLMICAQSEAERVISDHALPARKVVTLHYPLDLSVWYPGNKKQARALLGIPPDTQVVMYHGETLLWVKGLDVLLDSWERICKEWPDRDLRLILLGTGPDTKHVSRILETKQLHGVHWLNQWIHDRSLIQHYLSAADAYVFPSRRDAFGISIIEAMACGLPVVASNVRGIPDIFPEAEQSGGLLVAPGDVNALVRELNRILNDRAFAETLGQRARCHAAASFSMEGIGKQLTSFLLDGA